MFVLTVDARAAVPDALRRRVLAWPDEVGASAVGWLGNTGGVSEGGDFLLLMRFASQEAAWATSDLTVYAEWWQACREHLQTSPDFIESTRVTGILAGGSDDAAVVRITRGTASPSRLRDSLRRLESLAATERGGVIGGLVAWHDRDRFTEALYLTSESAQFGQMGTEPTPLRSILDDHEAAVRGAQVTDLDDPWLTSPGRPDHEEETR